MAYKHHQESPVLKMAAGRQSPGIPSSHKHRKHVVEKEDRESLEQSPLPLLQFNRAIFFERDIDMEDFSSDKQRRMKDFEFGHYCVDLVMQFLFFVFFLVVVSSEPSLGENASPIPSHLPRCRCRQRRSNSEYYES